MYKSESRQLPARSITAAWLHYTPSIIGLVFAAALYGTRSDLWPGRWAAFAIALLILVRVVHPVLAWARVRIGVFDDRITVRTGVLATRHRTVPWSSVSVADLEQPWSYRVHGLAIVSLHTGGEGDTTLRLAGLDLATAEHLSWRAQHQGRGPGDPRPEGSGEIVYRATSAELLIASAAYGQFLLIAAGVLVAAADALDTLGLWESALGAARISPGVWAAVAVVASVAAGFALSLVRYHGFAVRRTRGRLIIAHGLLSHRERVLHPAAIVGARVQRNLVEMIFDRVRISLHTVDTTRQIASNLVLPSLPRGAVARIANESLSDLVSSSTILSSPPRSALPRAVGFAVVMLLLLSAVIVVLTRLTPLSLALSGLLAALSAALSVGSAHLLASRIRLLDDRLLHSCFLVSDREDLIRREAVHVLSVTSWGARPPHIIRAHFLAGVPRALTAFTRDTDAPRRASTWMERMSNSVTRPRCREGASR